MVSLTLKMVSRHFCSTLWTFWPNIKTFENFWKFENILTPKMVSLTLKMVSRHFYSTLLTLCNRDVYREKCIYWWFENRIINKKVISYGPFLSQKTLGSISPLVYVVKSKCWHCLIQIFIRKSHLLMICHYFYNCLVQSLKTN